MAFNMPRTAIAVIVALLILAAAGAMEWYSHTMAGISIGGPVPLQSIAPRPPLPAAVRSTTWPSAYPPPAPPSTVPLAEPSLSPAPALTPAPAAAPKIFAVSLSTAVASGGQVVTGTVTTSRDVTSVQASIAGYSSALTKVSPGYFALSYRVPQFPPFLRRTYTIQITAQNAGGQAASSSLPITIR